jgi:hypothetical protein
MKLLIFLLIAYGVSNIVVFSSIFAKWRNFWSNISPNFWGTLFSCMICFPTWVGFLGSALIWSPVEHYEIVTNGINFFGLFNIPKGLISVFLDGCLTSGAVWLIHSIQEAIERHFSIYNNTLAPGIDEESLQD